MAHYCRFEVLVPVQYHVIRNHRKVRHSLDLELVQRFVQEAVDRFGGATQSHPAGGPPYRGWWWSNKHQKYDVDSTTYFFVLVPDDQYDEAVAFFAEWQDVFAKSMKQQMILITFSHVQTLGGFL